MKLRQSRSGEGLDTYVAQKHFHPLHSALSVLEALLMLAGAVALILFVFQGSFTGAGVKMDETVHAISNFISGLLALLLYHGP